MEFVWGELGGSIHNSAELARVLNSSFFVSLGNSRIGGFDGCGFGVLMCLDLGRRKK